MDTAQLKRLESLIKEYSERISTEEERECGKHSGFPECCIDFYLNHWLSPNFKGRLDYYALRHSIGVYVGYVPCLVCLRKKKFVTPKECCACNCASKKRRNLKCEHKTMRKYGDKKHTHSKVPKHQNCGDCQPAVKNSKKKARTKAKKAISKHTQIFQDWSKLWRSHKDGCMQCRVAEAGERAGWNLLLRDACDAGKAVLEQRP